MGAERLQRWLKIFLSAKMAVVVIFLRLQFHVRPFVRFQVFISFFLNNFFSRKLLVVSSIFYITREFHPFTYGLLYPVNSICFSFLFCFQKSLYNIIIFLFFFKVYFLGGEYEISQKDFFSSKQNKKMCYVCIYISLRLLSDRLSSIFFLLKVL